MKYAKAIRYALLLICIGGLGACATNNDKQGWNYDGSQAVDLMSTDQFLPLQQRDENGQVLPYQPAANPYSALEGRLEKDTVTRYIEARRAYRSRDYQQAEQILKQLIAENPDLSGPLVLLGDVATDQGQLAEAVEHYVAAIKVNPINFNAWLRLAKAQRMQGHFKHAQNTYAMALRKWPDGPELHLNLGVLYDLYLNEPLKAQAHMEAYQLLSGDRSGEVVAWLEEIRSRTGVQTALRTVEAESDPESRISQSEAPVPQASSSAAASDSGESGPGAAATDTAMNEAVNVTATAGLGE